MNKIKKYDFYPKFRSGEKRPKIKTKAEYQFMKLGD